MNNLTDRLLEKFERFSRVGFLNSIVTKAADKVAPHATANAHCTFFCSDSCGYDLGCYYGTNGTASGKYTQYCTNNYYECYYGSTRHTHSWCTNAC